jgi:hypothetical protein
MIRAQEGTHKASGSETSISIYICQNKKKENGGCFASLRKSKTSPGKVVMKFSDTVLLVNLERTLMSFNFLKWEHLTYRWVKVIIIIGFSKPLILIKLF